VTGSSTSFSERPLTLYVLQKNRRRCVIRVLRDQFAAKSFGKQTTFESINESHSLRGLKNYPGDCAHALFYRFYGQSHFIQAAHRDW
jgi:hypothetical protein